MDCDSCPSPLRGCEIGTAEVDLPPTPQQQKPFQGQGCARPPKAAHPVLTVISIDARSAVIPT